MRAGAQARVDAQAEGAQGRAERRQAGGSPRGRGSRRRRGTGVSAQGARGARPGSTCARKLGVLAGQLGQVGALCTWLIFHSVFF